MASNNSQPHTFCFQFGPSVLMGILHTTLFCHLKPLFKDSNTIFWNLFIYSIFIRLVSTIDCWLRYYCSWLAGSQFYLPQLLASLTLPQLFHLLYSSIFALRMAPISSIIVQTFLISRDVCFSYEIGDINDCFIVL